MIEITLSEARPGVFRADSTEYGSLSCSRTPFYDAARALLKFGVDPETEIVARHEGSETVAMRGTVGELAQWTVEESDARGLQKRKWKPRQKAPQSEGGVPENAL